VSFTKTCNNVLFVPDLLTFVSLPVTRATVTTDSWIVGPWNSDVLNVLFSSPFLISNKNSFVVLDRHYHDNLAIEISAASMVGLFINCEKIRTSVGLPNKNLFIIQGIY